MFMQVTLLDMLSTGLKPPALTITVLTLTRLLSLALCGKNESIQLASKEVPLLFQVFDSFLQPGVFLQRDLKLGPQVGDHHVWVVHWGWASIWGWLWGWQGQTERSLNMLHTSRMNKLCPRTVTSLSYLTFTIKILIRLVEKPLLLEAVFLIGDGDFIGILIFRSCTK